MNILKSTFARAILIALIAMSAGLLYEGLPAASASPGPEFISQLRDVRLDFPRNQHLSPSQFDQWSGNVTRRNAIEMVSKSSADVSLRKVVPIDSVIRLHSRFRQFAVTSNLVGIFGFPLDFTHPQSPGISLSPLTLHAPRSVEILSLPLASSLVCASLASRLSSGFGVRVEG